MWVSSDKLVHPCLITLLIKCNEHIQSLTLPCTPEEWHVPMMDDLEAASPALKNSIRSGDGASSKPRGNSIDSHLNVHMGNSSDAAITCDSSEMGFPWGLGSTSYLIFEKTHYQSARHKGGVNKVEALVLKQIISKWDASFIDCSVRTTLVKCIFLLNYVKYGSILEGELQVKLLWGNSMHKTFP